ncbi:HTH-type transcriptional activator TipA [Microbacterium lemovicicum]|uniref:HTH-type transcriptional activator TipA n=1 Tax=Microbacterium lemovicicum TaxID=1072463 RepID=A0A3Q9IVW0_9MICO|nr:MerR family transcriptional regulator [Microbacterium lemovicicum]AZS35542.1 HTH-type transcriptional activator TipA [Microbacterium lemovicicum]
MDWTIQDVARLTGTTSRTLRHYDAVGLLPPSSVGANGYRRYDEDALVRLQRILLLRELGLGLPQIADVLAREVSEEDALRAHLAWLEQEQERTARLVASVRRTIEARWRGAPLMAEDMFDGFDHTRYADEVRERWGERAVAVGDAWWTGMDPDDRRGFQARLRAMEADWTAAAAAGEEPEGAVAQALAARHVAWLRTVPGTPLVDADGDGRAYVIGLGELYVDDPRFSARYAVSDGDLTGARLVRDALRLHAETNL